jgi:hypothetical protein
MNHLSMEQMVALREPGAEPGDHAARAHLEICPRCRDEFERLHQRVARLKALPALRPRRDGWPAVRARFEAERRARRLRRVGVGGLIGLAAAASVALGVIVRKDFGPTTGASLAALTPLPGPSTASQLDETMARSRALEQAIDRLDPDTRVLDGQTARAVQELEDRIAAVDRQLEVNDLLNPEARSAQRLRLWQERVGLLDALVDVHLTNARDVGL